MQYRRLGKTELKVSAIGLGGAALSGEKGGYGFGEIGLDNSLNLLAQAFRNGINLIDTAPIYGFGTSEERIGKAISEGILPREEIVLVSKGGIDWHENMRVNLTNEPDIIERMLDESLERLKTDYLDIYMIHWPDPRVDISEPLEFLHEAKLEGRIKHIGLCNTNISDLTKSLDVCEVELVQSQMNWFEPLNHSVENFIITHDLGFMGWGTFDKGILTGRFLTGRTFPKEDARSWAPWWKQSNKDQKIELIKDKCSEIDNWVQFALQSPLSHDWVSSALCGFKTQEQLEDLLEGLALGPTDKYDQWKNDFKNLTVEG